MKTYFTFRTLILAAVFLLNSCQKDLDYIVPDPLQPSGPDTTWVTSLNSSLLVAQLKNSLIPAIHTDSFTLSLGTTATVNLSSGLTTYFNAGTLLNNAGQPATGNIQAESYLLQKKGDLIRMGIPTMSDGRLLVSGGAYYLKFKQAANNLQLRQGGRITAIYPDSNASRSMKVFFGEQAGIFNFNWLQNSDSTSNFVNATPNQNYQVTSTQLAWNSPEYFFDSLSAPSTRVSVSLPAQYTNANTMMYMAFNDVRSVVPLFGVYSERKFTSPVIPANQRVTLIVMSKMGNDYFLGHREITTAIPPQGGTVQEINMTGIISTLDQIKTYLQSL